MKYIKRILSPTLILILIFVFFGCTSTKIQVNTEQASDEYIANNDYQNYLNLYSKAVKTEDGYYFISDNHLYFLDKDSYNATIVCSKINCEHNDEGCSAFFSTFNYLPIQLSYYDNALYVLGWETEGSNIHNNYIYQISLDNFKRKKAVYINNTNGLSTTVFLLHRGYIYYTSGSSIMQETTSVLYRKQLGNTDKNDAGEKVFEITGYGASINDLSAYGNYVFISASNYKNENGDGYNTVVNCVDIHSLNIKNIMDSNEFAAYADSNYVYYENDETTVNRIDINTNEVTFFCNINGPCYISADSKYIYFDNLQSIYIGKTDENDRKILVYDKSGNHITDIIPKNPKDDCYFGGDDIMIFKEVVTGETVAEDGAKGYYVLDKSQLTSSDTQFIDME